MSQCAKINSTPGHAVEHSTNSSMVDVREICSLAIFRDPDALSFVPFCARCLVLART